MKPQPTSKKKAKQPFDVAAMPMPEDIPAPRLTPAILALIHENEDRDKSLALERQEAATHLQAESHARKTAEIWAKHHGEKVEHLKVQLQHMEMHGSAAQQQKITDLEARVAYVEKHGSTEQEKRIIGLTTKLAITEAQLDVTLKRAGS